LEDAFKREEAANESLEETGPMQIILLFNKFQGR
jgi:hypothetical protein